MAFKMKGFTPLHQTKNGVNIPQSKVVGISTVKYDNPEVMKAFNVYRDSEKAGNEKETKRLKDVYIKLRNEAAEKNPNIHKSTKQE